VPTTLLSPLLVIDASTPDDGDAANRRTGQGAGRDRTSGRILPRKLRNYYLLNPEETGERHYSCSCRRPTSPRLRPSSGHRNNRRTLAAGDPDFQLFEDLIAGRKGDFVAVCQGMAKLVVVDIALTAARTTRSSFSRA